MRYLLFIVPLLMLNCNFKPKPPKTEYGFADCLTVVNGYYKGASACVIREEDSDFFNCKTHNYYMKIELNGVETNDMICHEDLGE